MSYSLLSDMDTSLSSYTDKSEQLSTGDGDSETGIRKPADLSRDFRFRRRGCVAVLLQSTAAVLLGSIIGFLCTWNFSNQNQTTMQSSKEFAPHMSLTTVVFENIEMLYGAPSPETDAYWDSLIPPGRGFVQISNPAEYNLKGGISTEMGIDRYSVAMYHQLHCLAQIRRAYWDASKSSNNNQHVHTREQASSHHDHSKHAQHCFSYLAQSIMCSADLTIEWASHRSDGQRLSVNGWGVPHHQCKDPRAVRDWMTEHRSRVEKNYTHIDQ